MFLQIMIMIYRAKGLHTNFRGEVGGYIKYIYLHILYFYKNIFTFYIVNPTVHATDELCSELKTNHKI